MKAKLLRRIRKNWYIGITDTNTYACVQKRGFGADEWVGLHGFFIHILLIIGYGDIQAWRITEKHFAKKKERVFNKE